MVVSGSEPSPQPYTLSRSLWLYHSTMIKSPHTSPVAVCAELLARSDWRSHHIQPASWDSGPRAAREASRVNCRSPQSFVRPFKSFLQPTMRCLFLLSLIPLALSLCCLSHCYLCFLILLSLILLPITLLSPRWRHSHTHKSSPSTSSSRRHNMSLPGTETPMQHAPMHSVHKRARKRPCRDTMLVPFLLSGQIEL